MRARFALRRLTSALCSVMRSVASGGVIPMASAALAPAGAGSGLLVELGIVRWLDDGLIAIVRLLAGLEIERKVPYGRLRNRPDRAPTGVAALGGGVASASASIAADQSLPGTLREGAIPPATDIAILTVSPSLGLIAVAESPHLGTRTKIGVLVGSMTCMVAGTPAPLASGRGRGSHSDTGKTRLLVRTTA